MQTRAERVSLVSFPVRLKLVWAAECQSSFDGSPVSAVTASVRLHMS